MGGQDPYNQQAWHCSSILEQKYALEHKVMGMSPS